MSNRCDFGKDERGVSEVIGFVLIFGIIVILLSINQAQVVPAENSQVEFRHSQSVQGQLQELRNSIVTAAGTGSTSPVTIELGTQYPARVMAVNPPPASGRLRTEAVGSPPEITISNAVTPTAETNDYWTGNSRSFDTKSVVYRPSYNAYDGAPNSTWYENTHLFDRFDNGASLSRTDQVLIQDRTVTIVAINGSLDRSGSDTTTVDPKAISGPYREITIENDAAGDPIEIEFPSTVGQQAFTDMVDVPAHANVTETGNETLLLTLDPGTYTLRMAKIGVGSGTTDEQAHYMTWSDSPPGEVQSGTTHEVTVEVRDRFNNPVTGVETEVLDGDLTPNQQSTDEKGQATFNYTAPDSPGQDTIEIAIENTSSERERVRKTVDVTITGTGPGPSYDLLWDGPKIAAAGSYVDYFATNDTVVYRVLEDPDNVLTGHVKTTPPESYVSVDFSANDPSVVGGYSPEETSTDASGQATTDISVTGPGYSDLLASSMESNDEIGLQVKTGGRLRYNGDAIAVDGPDGPTAPGGVEFSVSNTYDTELTIEEITINPANGNINELDDQVGGGNNDPEEVEIYVSSPGNVDSYSDWGTSDFTGDYEALAIDDSVTVTVGVDGDNVQSGNRPHIDSGNQATFYLYEFYESDDPDDYENNQNINMSGEEVEMTVTYTVDGVQLSDTFTVVPGNSPAEGVNADFIYDRAGFSSNVELDGAPSNGDIVSYEWDVGNDGTIDYTGQTVQATIPYGADVKLIVTGSGGDIDTETQTVYS